MTKSTNELLRAFRIQHHQVLSGEVLVAQGITMVKYNWIEIPTEEKEEGKHKDKTTVIAEKEEVQLQE